jgi:hypothetical protein
MLLAPLALIACIAAAPSTVYVNATKLHLRKTPSTSAASVVRLPTNAPLRVMATEGEWLRVKIGDGREGFVAAAMTSSQQLTLDAALAHAEKANAAKNAKDRVMWLERAAALQSSREVLRELAVALRASGDTQRAALLEQRVSWPEDVMLAAARDGKRVAIELPIDVNNTSNEQKLDEHNGRAATDAELKAWGVVVGEQWWVLPARGAAVRAKVKGARLEVLNECGGTWGAVLVLELDRSPDERGDVAIAATRRAEPPASWRAATPAVNDLAQAEKAVRTALRSMSGSDEAQVRLASDANGEVIARAWWVPPERNKAELEFYEQTNRVVSLKLARTKEGAWRAHVVDETTGSHMNPNYPIARRDIDGDGAFDTFLTDDCSVRVVMDAGTLKYDDAATVVRAQTENRCCGC